MSVEACTFTLISGCFGFLVFCWVGFDVKEHDYLIVPHHELEYLNRDLRRSFGHFRVVNTTQCRYL